MAETKKTNTKKKSPAKGKMARPKKNEPLQAAAEHKKGKDYLGGVAQDIGEGAKTTGEKAAELGDTVIEKLKKGLSQAYMAGAKVVDELSHTAQQYAEKYKAESEVKKIEGEREELLVQLGHSIFKRYRAQGRVLESLFKEKEIIDQFNQIEKLDKQTVKIGKQLDKGKRTTQKQDR